MAVGDLITAKHCSAQLELRPDMGELDRPVRQRRKIRRVKRKGIFVIAFACLSCTAAWSDAGREKLPDPGLEARAVALQREFRCVVCQGESLDESSAPLAADLRKLIRDRVEKGESNAQIEQYLVARYGDFILMKPPFGLETYALWLGPLIVLIIGGVGAGVVVVRARRRLRDAALLDQPEITSV